MALESCCSLGTTYLIPYLRAQPTHYPDAIAEQAAVTGSVDVRLHCLVAVGPSRGVEDGEQHAKRMMERKVEREREKVLWHLGNGEFDCEADVRVELARCTKKPSEWFVAGSSVSSSRRYRNRGKTSKAAALEDAGSLGTQAGTDRVRDSMARNPSTTWGSSCLPF